MGSISSFWEVSETCPIFFGCDFNGLMLVSLGVAPGKKQKGAKVEENLWGKVFGGPKDGLGVAGPKKSAGNLGAEIGQERAR